MEDELCFLGLGGDGSRGSFGLDIVWVLLYASVPRLVLYAGPSAGHLVVVVSTARLSESLPPSPSI